MRVLLVANDGNHGGIARSIIHLISDLNGVRFQVVCGSEGPFAEELESMGVPVNVIDFTRPHFSLKVLSQLRHAIKKSRAQLVHAHHPRAYLRSRFAAMVERIPHISTPHVSVFDEIEASPTPHWRSKYMIFREHVTARMDRVTIALSQLNKDRLIAQGIIVDRIHIIPNGIDLTRFSPENNFATIKNNFGWSSKDFVVGYLGRLAPEKMLSDLLKAFSKLPSRSLRGGLNQLLIVGDGPERKTLENTAALLGLKERVRFVGHQEDVPEYLSAMDIVAFTSARETLPLVLLEAMAMEKAIVAVNIPVFSSILSDNSGLLVPRDRLNEGLETFIINPGAARQCGKRARLIVAANYNQANVRKDIHNLYRKVIESSGSFRLN